MNDEQRSEMRKLHSLANDSNEETQAKLTGHIQNNDGPHGLGLLVKVAKQTTEEDFLTMLETNEVPPIELTEEELELIRGGGWSSFYADMKAGYAAAMASK